MMSGLFLAILKFFEPPHVAENPEQLRRVRLLTGFGVLGALFGLIYTLFYLFIGHHWGAVVIILCSSMFALIPWLLRWGRSPVVLAELYSAILVSGFFALCWLEDGIHGHAIAWLVAVPLCALLLIGMKAAARWGTISILAAGFMAALEFVGMSPEVAYAEKWENIVSTAGYLGLILFMLLLGIIFERGREQAERKMLEANEKLSRANARLTQLNQEKNEFLSIAAHDLKNPLTVVRGMSDLIAQGILPQSKIVGAAEKISIQSVRMHELISNLLDLNAIEEGRMNLQPARVDVRDLVRQVSENFTEVAARKQIRIDRDLDAVPAAIMGDERALMQVMDNLVSNAIKYSPAKSVIEVHVVLVGETVQIRVVDHGPGISDADQKKLFQRFTRLTAQPTAGESSNGLGLSIVKRLVEAMDGRISCESRLGQGTTFVLDMPLLATEVISQRSERPDAQPVTTTSRLTTGVAA